MLKRIHIGIDPGGIRHGFAYRLPDGRYGLDTITYPATNNLDEFSDFVTANITVQNLLSEIRRIRSTKFGSDLIVECYIEVNPSKQGAWHDYLWQRWAQTVLPNLCKALFIVHHCSPISPEYWHSRLFGHNSDIKCLVHNYLCRLGVNSSSYGKDARDALCLSVYGYLSETNLYHHGIAIVAQTPPGLGEILVHSQ